MLGAFPFFPSEKVLLIKSKWHLTFGCLMLFGSYSITIESQEYFHYKVQHVMKTREINLCDYFLLLQRCTGLNLKLMYKSK